MKMNKLNFKKTAITMFTFLLSISMSANNVKKLIPLTQDGEGEPEPPGTPIDGFTFTFILICLAVFLVGFYFYKQTETEKTN